MSDTPREIATFVKRASELGSGVLATEEAWHRKYVTDVNALLEALADLGEDVRPIPADTTPPEPERHGWEEWEEMLGVRIHDPFGLGTDRPLTRREFLEGYMRLATRGDVNTTFAGHQVLMPEMRAIAMEGVPT